MEKLLPWFMKSVNEEKSGLESGTSSLPVRLMMFYFLLASC